MTDHFSLPVGIRDYTTEHVRRIEFISNAILDESELWGYKKILTPIFEKLDSLEVGLKQDSFYKTIKFIDPINGDVLGLRSDVTPQIARYVAGNYNEESLPLRLSYVERVVRNETKHSKNKRELFQVGCELVGPNELESDLEIVLLGSRILTKLGFDKQIITLNSSLFLNFVFSKLPSIKDDIGLLFHKKDFDSIRKFAKNGRAPKGERAFLKNCILPLIKNKTLAGNRFPPKVRLELKRIDSLIKLLKKINPSLTVASDLLDVKDFDYYSNITFDIAVPSINEIVLSGGRYDNLIGKYGKNLPAIGFGINTLPFLKKVKHAGFGIPVVSIDHAGSNDFETIFRLRDFFSSQGFVTIVSKSKHKVDFDLKIKVNSNGSLKLFNKKNKQIGSFKNLSELQKEDL
ncbi:MAG: ATP phosphoribosyltransferase regulatory subunit [Thermodesulfobacteriota bacterium]|nr:ATP phosphoribosyltransferase regulatory subunit [Thermodesulfobacteriota bacterium]